MYNTDLPTRAELPTSAQLVRSTVLAAASAAAILVTIVLPAEYAIDPTGVGKMLRLTEMGEIKTQLAMEAAQDRLNSETSDAKAPVQPVTPAVPLQPLPGADKRSSLLDQLFSNFVISSASAQQPMVLAQAAKPKTDETVFTLKPNEGAEYKMTMRAGGTVNFSWTVQGGVVNYDMHGVPADGGKEQSYKNGRGVTSDQGTLTAAGDGGQGWFFRNRSSQDVTITLKTNGAYSEIKRRV
jgi:hypothetical protein